MELPEAQPIDLIRSELETLALDDLAWDDASAFGYVFPAPGEVAELAFEAYRRFAGANGLDPTAFPSLARMENDLVAFGRTLARGDDQVVGAVTSGGTESILLAAKAARDAKRASGTSGRLNLVLPETGHAAFHKAASYLDLEVRSVATSPGFSAEPDRLLAATDDATAMVVVSTPSYSHGVVDPVTPVAAACDERGLWLHVDACVGGFLLPFLPDAPPFGFDIPGVASLSADIHKYGYAPKGSSLILYRNHQLRKHQFFATAEWTGYPVVNTTAQSTKSGGPLAAAWATVRALGAGGYRRLAEASMEAAATVRKAIETSPHLELLGDPPTPLLAFTAPNPFALCAALGTRGWFASPIPAFGSSPLHIHLTLTGVHAPVAGTFASDLAECAASTADVVTEDLLPAGVSLADIDSGALRQLLASIDLHADRPAIDKALASMDPGSRAAALTAFMDVYFTP